MRPLVVMAILGGGAVMMPAPETAAGPRPIQTLDQITGKMSMCGAGLKSAQDQPPSRPELRPGYGVGGLPISTANPRAQAFFDNGLQLAHAFSHDEAAAAMRESVRLDPGCAMCLWGEVYATGPMINAPVNETDAARLAGIMARAQRLARNARPLERALIAAMVLRFRDGGGGGPGDLAYARAMDRIAEGQPANDQLQTIAADAWMTYAVHSGEEQHFARARALLERVLTRDPDYVPAIHYYIHVTEMMGEAGQAELYADRLPALAPAASHLVHMPSHTYYRIGRYQDAADRNLRAVEIGNADARRIGLTDGPWGMPYHIHNVHFGVGGALISGDGETALTLARPFLQAVGGGERVPSPFVQMVMGTALFAEARFGDPAALLATTQPAEGWTYVRAYWRYARGEAAARTGNAAAVRQEIAAMTALNDGPDTGDGERAAIRMAQIARHVLEGRAAMLEDKPATALVAFWRAAQLQERPSFGSNFDPPTFWYPVRRDVAAALLKLRQWQPAVQEANAVLRDWPNEPMTLATRAAAQEGMGRSAAAGIDRRRAQAGWRGDPRMLLR